MRIEIIGNASGGASSISGLHTDFDSLLTETDSVIDALKKMRSFSYNMSGGIGILQNAVGNVDSRLQAEEIKKNAISSAKGKCESFLQLVSTIDSQVAETVSVNKENFYSLNKWARPSAIESTVESWYASAKEWIRNSVKTVADHFTHSFEVYNETDFSKLSDEELQEYYDKIVELLKSGDLCADDEIRLKSFMDYLSSIEVKEEMSDADKIRINMYINLYEAIEGNAKDKKAINDFFNNSAYDESGNLKNGVTAEDIANIKYLAYKSEGDVHKLFFDNISNCKVIRWDDPENNHYHFDDDGTRETGIYFRNKRGSYGTFFHEIGHHIDDLMDGALDGQFYSSQKFEFGTLRDAMVGDVETTVRIAIDRYSDEELKLSSSDKDKIFNVLMGRESERTLFVNQQGIFTSTYGAYKDIRLDHAYRKIYEDITGSYKGFFTRDARYGDGNGILCSSQLVSEVYCGVTNNTLMPIDSRKVNISDDGDSSNDSYGNKLPGHPFGYVDEDYYYNNGNINDGSSGVGESEFIGEYFRTHMLGEVATEEYSKRYLSQTYSFVERILKAKAM